MGLDIKTLANAKKSIKESLEGAGALKGQKGDPGKDGKDAPTITNISINENNVLSVTLSDGNIFTGGTIKTITGKDGVNGKNGIDGITPHINTITKHWFIGTSDTGIVAEGKDGLQGPKGEKGDTGEQGAQGIKGDKGEDGYPFLIYKEYSNLSEFSVDDFPEIGLMFIVRAENAATLPVYRYTGEAENPYSFITNLSGSEGIKGDKGDTGEQGIQGIPGKNGRDGIDGLPGKDGVDGITPHIDLTTKHWFIGSIDTGIIAEGQSGTNGTDGSDGIDGITPHIGENHNWFIGDTDTGVNAGGQNTGNTGNTEFNWFSDDAPLAIRQNIPRGISLGTEITKEQLSSIRIGIFEGMWLGDYWEIDDTKWRIVDMNYNPQNAGMKNSYSNNIVLMPDDYIDLSKDIFSSNADGILTEARFPFFETAPTTNYSLKDSFATTLYPKAKEYINSYFPNMDLNLTNRWTLPWGNNIDKTTGKFTTVSNGMGWLQFPTAGQIWGVNPAAVDIGGSFLLNSRQFKYFRTCSDAIYCKGRSVNTRVQYWLATPTTNLRLLTITDTGMVTNTTLDAKLYFRPFLVYQS